QQEADAGEAADGGLRAGEPDDAGSIGQEERDFVGPIAARTDAETEQEGGGFTHELTALAGGGAENEGEAFGVMPGGEDGAGGGDGGLAPLAGAVEDDLLRAGGEDEGLAGIGMKAEA